MGEVYGGKKNKAYAIQLETGKTPVAGIYYFNTVDSVYRSCTGMGRRGEFIDNRRDIFGQRDEIPVGAAF